MDREGEKRLNAVLHEEVKTGILKDDRNIVWRYEIAPVRDKIGQCPSRDLHYWKDCPMLLECQYCQQVIEISGLRAHYLDECEKFPINDIYKVPDSENPEPNKILPQPGSCPLCFEPIDGSSGGEEGAEAALNEELWVKHLLQCPANVRKFGLVSAG